jgi:hypothetical protein
LVKRNRQHGGNSAMIDKDVFGHTINASNYAHNMKLLEDRVPCFRELISAAAIARVHDLAQRRWLRNPDAVGIGQVLTWRVRQRGAAVNPENADILFLMGQTKATMEVYERLKQHTALTKPILLSVAPGLFPIGVYKLPPP